MTPQETPTSTATLKRAYLTMERLQRQVAEYERARSEPIAVVGLGCRFPGSVADPESYWKLLSEGTDAITEVPADRWDVDAFYDERPRTPGKASTRWGGFVDRIDRFDHDFFNISRREAMAMDPQQRLALEVAWEALEHGGIAPHSLAGSRTGVFMGVCSTDYTANVFGHPADITAYASTGTAHSILPGRISYLLDLRGPSLAVDTACSSSLVAVHQACQSLRSGDCDMALSGGVNAVLTPQAAISFSQFPDMLSTDGRCKTFDASANGFVRSEGCGVVVLKRLSDALAAEDRVLGVIRGSAVNQDGHSSGITAPNGAAQRDVLRRALDAAGVDPADVGYIETHGTGTKLGDPIEVEALAEIYGRPEGEPLYLGSSKTNLGHLEAAAGVAGLIKIVTSLQHAAIPPTVHFKELNPHISFDGTTFAVPTALTPWTGGERRRLAGLSSFGFSGTNVHLIVEEPPAPSGARPGHDEDRDTGQDRGDTTRPRSLLTVSAKSETALLALAQRHAKRLTAKDPAPLADICYSANTGRSHFPHRIAAVGATRTELAAKLRGFVMGEPADGLFHDEADSADVVFLFTGQGPQRTGMARGLYATQPTFRRVLDRCDEILRPVLETPLLSVLYSDDAAPGRVDEMAYSQPVLFAVEYALAELWRSWGVEPAAVLGHSLGEYAAACFAGAMSLEDGLHLIAERGRLLQTLAETGAMAAVFAPAADVAEVVAGYPAERISVAAVNGRANTAVSGDREAVAEVCAAFEARGAQTKLLRISTSSHSPLVEPILEPLRRLVEKVEFAPPRVPVVSNLTGELWPWDQAPDADYWCRHAREAVRFAEGVTTLHDLGYRTFLEVGPAPTLLGLVGDTLPPGSGARLVPSLRPKEDDWEGLLGAAAELYVGGVDLDWARFDADYTRTRTDVPLYAFDRTRCWQRPSGTGAAFSWTGGDGSRPGDEGEEVRDAPARAPRRRGRESLLPTPEELRVVPDEEREGFLTDRLLTTVRAVLRSKGQIEPDQQLTGLGLDSLMAVEIRNDIQDRLGVTLPIAAFLKGMTVRGVASRILEQLPDPAAEPGPAAGPAAADDVPITRVERFEDVAEELLAELDGLNGGTAA
ncbi:type I polyketide synthase [Streptomyces sp. WMMC897]|uniref:type I polyketide synthase n=1 Tax=Streptomyces sp. WMMC897 TaxID=3014782 RepID=UPI0022B7488F|nr:beta-ketoacyl synthase N-terminal-like domain-containing protein [Streptomyces sp. WMMC897]MCZ7414354.1 beta-ketoacyl synthase N-terminal-like domain-containing protein [Streptomyces sp. WMMC897]